jgi:deleted-in-malignant-brain-tumors protein 1
LIQTDCGDGDVRLIRGRNSLEGRVEVCYDGVWGTVCSHGWDRLDANVVCRQLGFSGSGALARLNGYFGRGSGSVFLTDVRCGGLESRLFDCQIGDLEQNDCSHYQDAGITCLAGCATGNVRLVGGSDLSEGRVEICLNREWGTVCDTTWDVFDGSVVCRQLGLVSIGK